jgi:predicted component of type VI protein secretion system
MHINDPLSRDQAPSSARTFGSKISSPPRRCCQCAEYSSRISDLEARLTLAKCQAQMAMDKASKACGLTKQISILDDKVSSLMEKIVHHEEWNSFVLGIIESAYEMLRCKIPFDLSFFLFCPTAIL